MSEVTYSGEWIVDIFTDKFPPHVKLAFFKLNGVDDGITYKPIALLATQVVDGCNYVVLAEKSSVWEPHAKRNVLVTFYAKPGATESKDIEITSITLLKIGQYIVTIPNGQLIDISRLIQIIDNVQETLGGWEIDVETDKWPADVDKAIDLLNNQLGATYRPIAYLGKQLVNGQNYAILAELTVVRIYPGVSIVLIIFNVNDGKIQIISIENIIESYGFVKPGSIIIHPTTNIPDDVMNEFNSVMEHFVGAEVKPFAYLGEQIVSGVDRYFAAEVTAVLPGAKPKICLVVINAKEKSVKFKDIL